MADGWWLIAVLGGSTEVIGKAQALQKNPADERLKREVMAKVQEMEDAMEQLKNAMSFTTSHWPLDNKLQLTTHYIADQARRARSSACPPPLPQRNH